jgi:hypothetical protein
MTVSTPQIEVLGGGAGPDGAGFRLWLGFRLRFWFRLRLGLRWRRGAEIEPVAVGPAAVAVPGDRAVSITGVAGDGDGRAGG